MFIRDSLSTDYGAMKKAVDPKDSFLTSAISYGGGIRILRQDMWETILCFLISQNNNCLLYTSYERSHKKGVENTFRLLKAYLG